MTPTRRLLLIAAMGLALAALSPAQAPARPGWEYASVTSDINTEVTPPGALPKGYTSRATVCFPDAKGCRSEAVQALVEWPDQGRSALMLAANRLGEQGWELVTASEVQLDTSNGARTLYFRRPRSR